MMDSLIITVSWSVQPQVDIRRKSCFNLATKRRLDLSSYLSGQQRPAEVSGRRKRLARIAWLGSGRAWQRFPVIMHIVCRHSSCQGVDDDKAKNPGDYRTVGRRDSSINISFR